MDSIQVNNLEFHGPINKRFKIPDEHLVSFSYEFTYGKSYLLSGEAGQGGFALSWILGGLLDPQQGSIYQNGVPYSAQQRKEDGWCVHYSEVKRFGLLKQSVKAQVRHGLRTTANPYLKSEAEVIERFRLTPERYDRPMGHLSGEAWSASCAIGFVHGKRIFCFPWSIYRIEEYTDLWLKKQFDLLTSTGSLVIIPFRETEPARRLCDEVVRLRP